MVGGFFFGGGLGGGGGGGWGDNHRHTPLSGFGGNFWSVATSCVDTLVVCTSLPLINIGAFLTVCIQKMWLFWSWQSDTVGYAEQGSKTAAL